MTGINTSIAYNFISFMGINYILINYIKVLQIPYSFQWGIWPFNAGVVLSFFIRMMICFNGFVLFINIKYQISNVWIFLITFDPLDVGIAFGGQDPLTWWGIKFLQYLHNKYLLTKKGLLVKVQNINLCRYCDKLIKGDW